MAGDARGDNVPPAIVVYHSASPYTTWNGPITLVTGIIANDDIAVVTALPGKIGVLWSNQNASGSASASAPTSTAPIPTPGPPTRCPRRSRR